MKLTKADAVRLCLLGDDDGQVDLWRLREMALSEGGFLNDLNRRKAWPKLVGINQYDGVSVKPDVFKFIPNGSDIPSESELAQVHRDVLRSSWHLLTPNQRKKWKSDKLNNAQITAILRSRQLSLGHLINIILREGRGDLCYYQGFHDIGSIFLTVLSSDMNHVPTTIQEETKEVEERSVVSAKVNLGLPSAVLFQICKSGHLNDFMKSTFSSLCATMNIVLFPLIRYFDPEVHSFLKESAVEPFFALSWIVTWFSHDIKDTKLVARIFDAFLAAHPLFPFYVAVAMICHPNNRNKILDTECDFACVHHALSSLPKYSCSAGWMRANSGDRGYNMKEDDQFELPYGGKYLDDIDGNCDSDLTPFQDLIDMAISFMRKVPPRRLLPLANRYRKGVLKPYLEEASSIAIFQNPPSWAILATASADWVLRGRADKLIGTTNDNNNMQKIRRRKKKSSNKSHKNSEKDGHGENMGISEDDLRLLRSMAKNTKDAVVASGIGPDVPYGGGRKITFIILGGITIVVLVLGLGLAKKISSEDKFKFSIWDPPIPSVDMFKSLWFSKEKNLDESICLSSMDASCLSQEIVHVNNGANTKQGGKYIKSILENVKVMLSSEAEIVLL